MHNRFTGQALVTQIGWGLGIAVLALAAGVLLGNLVKETPEERLGMLERATSVHGQERPPPEFSLLDHNRGAVTAASLEGHWSLMFFGYTHCPDVCPVTLGTMQQAVTSFEPPSGPAPSVRVFFVSVDPERDTPERLSQYVTHFNPDFVGVTGSPAELEKLTKGLGIVYAKAPEENGQAYLVDHSASVLVFNPRGELYAVFSPPHDAAIIARDLSNLVAAFNLAPS